eukprot:TRINITY_DN1747_c2_g1_i1.p1 TRINITY_DN1747_c2_g1~~TRINITY_DN1747_c2_g1_i1.p1  ORF type:complete len:744 (+),score=234.27 TRINITY_DN1747_c2_g1_i1:86-2317(+)
MVSPIAGLGAVPLDIGQVPDSFPVVRASENPNLPANLREALGANTRMWLWWMVTKISTKAKKLQRFWGIQTDFMFLCDTGGNLHRVMRIQDIAAIYVQEARPMGVLIVVKLLPSADEPSLLLQLTSGPRHSVMNLGGRPGHEGDPIEPLRVLQWVRRVLTRAPIPMYRLPQRVCIQAQNGPLGPFAKRAGYLPPSKRMKQWAVQGANRRPPQLPAGMLRHMIPLTRAPIGITAETDERYGMTVQEVPSGSAADQGGITPGRRLIQVGGKPVNSREQLNGAVDAARHGGQRVVEVVTAPPAVLPPEGPLPDDCRLLSIRPDPGAKLGIEFYATAAGVWVQAVTPGSPAAMAGVKEGLQVVGIDGVPTRDGNDVRLFMSIYTLRQPSLIEVLLRDFVEEADADPERGPDTAGVNALFQAPALSLASPAGDEAAGAEGSSAHRRRSSGQQASSSHPTPPPAADPAEQYEEEEYEEEEYTEEQEEDPLGDHARDHLGGDPSVEHLQLIPDAATPQQLTELLQAAEQKEAELERTLAVLREAEGARAQLAGQRAALRRWQEQLERKEREQRAALLRRNARAVVAAARMDDGGELLNITATQVRPLHADRCSATPPSSYGAWGSPRSSAASAEGSAVIPELLAELSREDAAEPGSAASPSPQRWQPAAAGAAGQGRLAEQQVSPPRSCRAAPTGAEVPLAVGRGGTIRISVAVTPPPPRPSPARQWRDPLTTLPPPGLQGGRGWVVQRL